MRSKKLNFFEKNPGLWGFLSLIIAILVFIWGFFIGKNYELNIQNNLGTAVNGSTINGNLHIGDNKPTETTEKKDKIFLEDGSKISTFFISRYSKNYFNAQNNISQSIQLTLSESRMKEFRLNMNKPFKIISDLKQGEIQISDFITASKHIIKLEYEYKNIIYIDNIFIKVQRDQKDKNQYHIVQIECEGTSGPLCGFLKR